MKTTVLVIALVIGCIIPTYSQLNRHRKMERNPEPLLQKENKENMGFDTYKFDSKFNDSWNKWTPDNFGMAPTELMLNESKGHAVSPDRMPTLKPEGIFHMRLFQPEGKYSMKIYLLDY